MSDHDRGRPHPTRLDPPDAAAASDDPNGGSRPGDLHVPDSLAGAPFAVWGEHSYGAGLWGSGAVKLGGSVVAPLLAVARGYRSCGPQQLREVLATNGFHPASLQAKQLRTAVGDREALLMPWFTAADVSAYWARPGLDDPGSWYDTRPSSLQYRPHPANVVTDAAGRKAKYQNLAGQQTVMGVHPGTPPDWLATGAPTLLVTEGLLKADSALTAYLRRYGADEADLSAADDPDIATARSRIRALLEAVPAAERVLVVSILGVGTWRQNPEWSTLRVKGNHVWVAFDGDVATKPAVWKQARDLFEFLSAKGGVASLLDLSAVPTAPGPAGAKVGVDDFLAGGGSWDELIRHLVARLPDPPRGDQESAPVRMHGPSLTYQERVGADPDGGGPALWVTRAEFAARVVSLDERRCVTDEELASGTVCPQPLVRPDAQTCRVEISWLDPDKTPRRALVDASADLLMTRPDRWREPRVNARIPASVLELPQWPPRAEGFLEAMKRWRAEERVRRFSWEHMGWVPTDTTPAFIVGSQVIGPDGEEPALASSAVTEEALAGASRFGVQLPQDPDLQEVREAVRTVLSTYRACWSEPAHASVVIAAALRPTVPLPNGLAVLFSGTTAAGKSYSSAAIMAFWQARPGAWTSSSLPGSAADTAASTEHALARTPIWVMDDLAPTATDPVRQARAADTMNEIIRSVFNSSAHRRMTRDLTSRAAPTPRALLVCSAEAAPLGNHSIMNRLVHVRVRPGFLVPGRGPTDALVEMSGTTAQQSLITGYALQLAAGAARRNGWVAEQASWAVDVNGIQAQARCVIDARVAKAAYAERVAKTVADLSLGLVVLERVVESLGMLHERFDDPVGASGTYAQLLETMFEDIMTVAVEGVAEGKDIAPGRTALNRLRSLLASGRGYIASAGGVPGPPAVAGLRGFEADANAVNQALGWTITADDARPASGAAARLGVLHCAGDGEPVVLLDPGATFAALQREFGRDGHNQKSLFDAWWSEGVCTEQHWKRKRWGGAMAYTVRVRSHGQLVNVLPISLSLLLGNGEEDDDGG